MLTAGDGEKTTLQTEPNWSGALGEQRRWDARVCQLEWQNFPGKTPELCSPSTQGVSTGALISPAGLCKSVHYSPKI